jgi:hypothetical protein
MMKHNWSQKEDDALYSGAKGSYMGGLQRKLTL